MAKKNVPVRGYVKKSGIAVSGHSRKLDENNTVVVGKVGPSKKSLQRIGGDPSEMFRNIAGTQVPLVGSVVDPLKLNFFGRSLVGENLSGLDLRGANFKQSSLREVDFTGADLRGANFSESLLADVNFSDAKLEEINFTSTELVRIKANEISLKNANLQNASLSFDPKLEKPVVSYLNTCKINATFLCWMDVSNQDLRNMSIGLNGAAFYDMDFSDCNLEGVNLNDTNFRQSDLSRCNLRGAQMERVVFSSVVGRSMDASEANFHDARLVGNSNMSGSNFSGSQFTIKDANMVNFEDSNFSHVTMRRKGGPSITLCNFSNSDFSGCDLGESDFSFHKQQHLQLLSCTFSNVNWKNTRIQDIVLGREGSFDETGMTLGVDSGNSFEKYTLREAHERLELTDKQFQFMVLSGALEVREKNSNEIVRSHFDMDSDLQYVPIWAIQNFRVD